MGAYVYGAPPAGDKLIAYNYTPYSSPNTTAEVICTSLAVPAASFAANDIMEVFVSANMNTSGGTKTYKMYASVSGGSQGGNVPVGAVLLAQSSDFASLAGAPFSRFFPILSASTCRAAAPTSAKVGTQYNTTTGAPETITFNKFNEAFYLLVSVQKASGTDTGAVDYVFVARRK